MGKTYRKDKEGNKFIEGNPLKDTNVNYRCRCEYCTGVTRNQRTKKILSREKKLQLKNCGKNENK